MNLGDCLWAAHMLSKCQQSGPHQLYCKPEWVKEIAPLLGHTEHKVLTLDQKPDGSHQCWIANGKDGSVWSNPDDIMGYVMGYMNHFARVCGEPEDIYKTREDMLWDVPAIPKPGIPPVIDVLICNALPTSGQVNGHDRLGFWEDVIIPLQDRWRTVVFTNCSDNSHRGYSCQEIGILSTISKRILAVANGPHWPTWNVHATHAERIIMLEPQRLDYGKNSSGRLLHANTPHSALMACKSFGWL